MILWTVRQLLVWGALGLFAVLVFSDDGAVRAKLIALVTRHADAPPAVEASGAASRTLTVRAGQGGHFWVEAEVDGTTLPFLVDTGATSVTLSQEATERLGLRLGAHDFTERSQTAGGMVRTAPVSLREVRIGPLSVRDVDASVNPRLSGISLLGMSFLNRLDGYEVRGDRLLLYW